MPGERPIPDPHVHEMEIDGEVTLLHRETQTALVLNDTAGDVWRLLDGRRTVSEIVDTLCAAYGTERDIVRAGVESALRSFEGQGFLTAATG